MSPLKYILSILLLTAHCQLPTVSGQARPAPGIQRLADTEHQMFLPIVRDAECITHTAAMSLSATATTLRVGETTSVTSTLHNLGCVALGVPMHTLRWDSPAPAPVFAALTPLQVTHHLAVPPGGYDQAEFVLLAVGPGRATLRAGASYEVHIGYPGPAYWSGSSAPPLVITVLP